MLAKAMSYEDIKPHKVSKTAAKKEVKRLREVDINKMTTGQIVWHLVCKHKFGVLATFTIIYVTLSLFHTLIFGLIKSI